jgi:hypothetical protein
MMIRELLPTIQLESSATGFDVGRVIQPAVRQRRTARRGFAAWRINDPPYILWLVSMTSPTSPKFH